MITQVKKGPLDLELEKVENSGKQFEGSGL